LYFYYSTLGAICQEVFLIYFEKFGGEDLVLPEKSLKLFPLALEGFPIAEVNSEHFEVSFLCSLPFCTLSIAHNPGIVNPFFEKF